MQSDVLEAPGAQQAIIRSDMYIVRAGTREVAIYVPDSVGAIVAKAAAYTVDSRDKDRHLEDLVVLLAATNRRVLDLTGLSKKDKKHLRPALAELDNPLASWWAALDSAEAARGQTTLKLFIEALNP